MEGGRWKVPGSRFQDSQIFRFQDSRYGFLDSQIPYLRYQMKQFLFIAFLLSSSFLFAQEAKVMVTPKTSVVFPSQPSKTENGPVTTFSYTAGDSLFVYTVAVVDLEATNGLSAETLALAAADPSFWDQAEGGFMNSMGAETKKIKREIRKINGKEAMYIEVEKPGPNGERMFCTAMILVEGKFSVNFVHVDKTKRDPNRDKFFSSVETLK